MKKLELKIKGMTCNHCKMKVEETLTSLDGVKKAKVHLKKERATITFDEQIVTADELKNAVSNAGYTPSNIE